MKTRSWMMAVAMLALPATAALAGEQAGDAAKLAALSARQPAGRVIAATPLATDQPIITPLRRTATTATPTTRPANAAVTVVRPTPNIRLVSSAATDAAPSSGMTMEAVGTLPAGSPLRIASPKTAEPTQTLRMLDDGTIVPNTSSANAAYSMPGVSAETAQAADNVQLAHSSYSIGIGVSSGGYGGSFGYSSAPYYSSYYPSYYAAPCYSYYPAYYRPYYYPSYCYPSYSYPAFSFSFGYFGGFHGGHGGFHGGGGHHH